MEDRESVSEGGKASDGSVANEYTAQWRIYTDRARAHAAEVRPTVPFLPLLRQCEPKPLFFDNSFSLKMQGLAAC